MKNLLLNLDEWQKRLRRKPLAIFLDYDGTLSAIASTPAQAKLPHVAQEILKALVKLKNVKVAIISGRGLDDLRRMVPVKGLSYVGSHGIEFQLEEVGSKSVPKRYLQKLVLLRRHLAVELKDVSGAMLEQKPFSLAIHYRRATPTSERKIKRVVLDACEALVHQDQISIMSGKKVIEIMPSVVVNKGQAVERLLRLWGRKKYLPVYIGDDRTDEAAFEVLRGRGLTVRVGRPSDRSKAEYFVNGVPDVRMFLELILWGRAI